MKIKPLYIYLASFALLIILLIVFTGDGDKTPLPTKEVNPHSEMPDDDVHKNLGQDMPGSGSVSPEFRQKMENLKASYEANPQDTATAHEYAQLLAAAHKPDESVEVYESILKVDPNRSDIRLELATVYYNLQNFDKAKTEMEKVLELEPNAADAKYNLGAIEFALGNTEKATKIWNEVIEESPNSEAADYARRSLESLN